MNKEYDIDLILPNDVFKSNQAKTLKRDIARKKRGTIKEIKRWVVAILEAPFVFALWFFFYSLMVVMFG